jgi:peptide/nickel transport system substrate-binding protein
LIQTTPKLQYKMFLPGSPTLIGMRTDKQDLPFKDKRVRQALMMATDFQALKRDLYGGNAEILVWPLTPAKGFEDLYVPLDKLPASVQELYSYNPTKAKQLLADVGYPNGFKTKIMVQNTAVHVDPASAIKAMWAKVGVDLEIQPKEYGVYASAIRTRQYDEMVMRTSLAQAGYGNFASFRGQSQQNPSYVDDPPGKDPRIEETYQEIQKNILVNQPKVNQLYQDLMPYLLEQAYVIPRPTSYSYTFWWPWVKNYHGELGPNYSASEVSWIPWVWIDQDLRMSMTGR